MSLVVGDEEVWVLLTFVFVFGVEWGLKCSRGLICRHYDVIDFVIGIIY